MGSPCPILRYNINNYYSPVNMLKPMYKGLQCLSLTVIIQNEDIRLHAN